MKSEPSVTSMDHSVTFMLAYLWFSSGMSQGFQQVEMDKNKNPKINENKIFIDQATF